MVNNELLFKLPEALLPWYRGNKRDLPWRGVKDPYLVWISEIMLQQTRVEAVIGYYTRFINALPDVEALSNVEDDILLKLWEGLGYYTRARNLKKAAIKIMTCYEGRFPTEYDDVINLPGIGEYTAGAICSIAFNQPTPAVDGNVLRVVARLLGDATPVDLPFYKKQVRSWLSMSYPKETGEYTQALMELGATVCGPNRKPRCEICPCKQFCVSFKENLTEEIPVRLPKREKRVEELTVYILNCDDKYAVVKRPDYGLLAGLWQFPYVPGNLDVQEALDKLEKSGVVPGELLKIIKKEHVFTHIKWEMQGVYVNVKNMPNDYLWVSSEELEKNIALPTAFRQFWILREEK